MYRKTNSFRLTILLGKQNGNHWRRFTPQTNLHKLVSELVTEHKHKLVTEIEKKTRANILLL